MKVKSYFFTGFFILLVTLLIVVNNSIVNKINEATDRTQTGVNPSAHIVKLYDPKNRDENKVIRKTWIDPNREFWVNVFYKEDEEIARYKSNEFNIYDIEGKIPDGKVMFYNQTDKTEGYEYYQDGKRHGDYKEFYDNGQPKIEADFGEGKMIANKVYFYDGKVRMEQDLKDAMWVTENKEIGTGKIYFRDGGLMYEYHLTNTNKGGYNVSYDRYGNITEVNYFDQNGQKIGEDLAPAHLKEMAYSHRYGNI